MGAFRRLAWGCALGLLGTGASPVGAAWGDGVPVCDHCGYHAACYPPPPPPPVYVQRSCYEPATCYQPPPCECCRPRYGPIRRLLRRCCRVPAVIFRPSCKCEPVPVYPPPCPPPCGACAVPPAPAPVILSGPPPVSPGASVFVPPPAPRPAAAVPPGTGEPLAPAFGAPDPGSVGERITPPPPSPPMPPASGSSYKPLTPPLPPRPVRLDHVASLRRE